MMGHIHSLERKEDESSLFFGTRPRKQKFAARDDDLIRNINQSVSPLH